MLEESQKKFSDKIKLPRNLIKEIEKISEKKKLSKEQKEKLEEEVRRVYINEKFEPGEAIGIIAAQSISEPATQMCCDFNEKIIVKYHNDIQIVKIGEFAEKIFNEFGYKKVNEYFICDLPNDIKFFVPSINQEEKIEWKRIKSCIKIKAAKKLLKIKTRSGRQIVATDAHSFVVRRNNKIIPIAGIELKKGDRIPVIRYLPINCNRYLNFGTEKVKLNSNFGWLIGAYSSEGSVNGTQISISKNFLSNAKSFVKNWNLKYGERDYTGQFGPSHSFYFSSPFLSRLLLNTCGSGSKNKIVPEFAFSAPEEFVSSLLRGYFDGDGSISVSRKMIRAHSNSEELIDGIKFLLTRFGIFAYKYKKKKQFYLLIPYKYAPKFLEKIGSDIKERKERLEKLGKLGQKSWDKKSQDFTDMISGFGDILYQTAKKLKYPTRYVSNFTKRQKIGRTTLYRYTKLFERIAKEKNINIKKELKILKRMLNSDVVWDEINEINYVKPSSEYVYDISVDGLETFATFDGIITHNTMRTYHFAGSAGIKITYGLPRLIEIFDAKRAPATPFMTIYLKKRFNNRNMATKIAQELIEKKVLNLVKKVSIDLSEGTIELEPVDLKKIKKIVRSIKEQLKEISVRTRAKKIVVCPKSELDIRELQKLKERVMNVQIEGVKDILNAVVRREGSEWIITTTGSNLEEVLKIKGVDERRTVTNDIYEMKRVFGIEAARNLIINEALKTMQEQGLDVDIRHVMLVADIMTFTGDIRPIGRYGVAGTKASILARAAFEETIKHLVRASVRGEADNFEGIFENVMLGQVIPSGTGMFELISRKEEEK